MKEEAAADPDVEMVGEGEEKKSGKDKDEAQENDDEEAD